MSVAAQIIHMLQLRPAALARVEADVLALKGGPMSQIDMSEADRYGVRNATQFDDITKAAATPGVGRTDIQAVATWLAVLRYGDMMKVARGIAGEEAKDEEVVSLADKLHTWADANKVPD